MECTGDRGCGDRTDCGTAAFNADRQADQCGIPICVVDAASQHGRAAQNRCTETLRRRGDTIGSSGAASVTCAPVSALAAAKKPPASSVGGAVSCPGKLPRRARQCAAGIG